MRVGLGFGMGDKVGFLDWGQGRFQDIVVGFRGRGRSRVSGWGSGSGFRTGLASGFGTKSPGQVSGRGLELGYGVRSSFDMGVWIRVEFRDESRVGLGSGFEIGVGVRVIVGVGF